MGGITKSIRKILLYVTTLFLVAGYPLAAMAQSTESVNPVTPPAATTTTEASVTQPAPKPEEPKKTYTYNEATGHWDSNLWQYNPTSGTYEKTPQPPTVIQPTTETGTTNTAAPTSAAASATPVDQTTSSTAATDIVNNTALNNALNSSALTGNGAVTGNTSAGSATTGNASAAATILNNVNSTINSGDNQKAASFVSDVMGDVNGDIILYPALLKAMLESGAANTSTSGTVAANNTNQINNDITLNATSGNATVDGNTKAGNATTGSANTVVDVINIINSMVSANQSFIGTVNIYGNLNGDILIAPDFIPQLLADNKGTSQLDQNSPTSVVSSNDTQSIVNNIALAAESGSAAVLGNTKAGSATTGSAETNVVIFNLSGHQIVASNSLLVFINVLGTWVGVIVDAPEGATAAAIGNGVTDNSKTTTPDLAISTNNTSRIVNNISLTSQSGDATVSRNTLAGDATSGDATASANIANITGSQFNLSGWFGVLFINVFGSWHGSFGVDTPNGNPISDRADNATVPKAAAEKGTMRVMEFVPRQAAAATIISSNNDGGHPQVNEVKAAVLSSMNSTQAPIAPVIKGGDYRLPITLGAMGLVGFSLLGLKRMLFGKDQGTIA